MQPTRGTDVDEKLWSSDIHVSTAIKILNFSSKKYSLNYIYGHIAVVMMQLVFMNAVKTSTERETQT